MPLFAVFLVCIFPHPAWLRKDTEYLSVFSLTAGKYGTEKLWIQILFRHWYIKITYGIQRSMQNPFKHLRWSILRKHLAFSFQLLIIFVKSISYIFDPVLNTLLVNIQKKISPALIFFISKIQIKLIELQYKCCQCKNTTYLLSTLDFNWKSLWTYFLPLAESCLIWEVMTRAFVTNSVLLDIIYVYISKYNCFY